MMALDLSPAHLHCGHRIILPVGKSWFICHRGYGWGFHNDLILSRRLDSDGKGRVSLLLNTGSANFESTPNVDFQTDLGILKPSFVELADMDNTGSLDILVAGEDAITLLYNNGMGTNDKLSYFKT